MFKLHDVFDPMDGETVITLPLFLAKAYADHFKLDYAPKGEGWI